MDLYTSLTRLKMAMNGGTLPPMTALTDRAKALIDPAFTPGMGALEEDPKRGLRCPIRGCGKYFHWLGIHLQAHHISVRDLKLALEIPMSASLLTKTARERSAEVRRDHIARIRTIGRRIRRGERLAGSKASEYSLRQNAAGIQNLRDTCEAQLRNKLSGLAVDLGRAPTMKEARHRLGRRVVDRAVSAYGSWDSFVVQCGQMPNSRGPGPSYGVHEILCCFGAWVEEHGDLPTISEIETGPRSLPLLPSPQAVHRALGTRSWPEAMQQVAAALDMHGGRYGLPVQEKSA